MPKTDKRQQKRWCFTLNNYTDVEIRALTGSVHDVQPIYAVVGRECGHDGTPHLQGFIHFKTRLSFRQVKNIVGVRSHLEPARGSDDENRTYCRKESNVELEIGHPVTTAKGHRESADFTQSALLFAARREIGRAHV